MNLTILIFSSRQLKRRMNFRNWKLSWKTKKIKKWWSVCCHDFVWPSQWSKLYCFNIFGSFAMLSRYCFTFISLHICGHCFSKFSVINSFKNDLLNYAYLLNGSKNFCQVSDFADLQGWQCRECFVLVLTPILRL